MKCVCGLGHTIIPQMLCRWGARCSRCVAAAALSSLATTRRTLWLLRGWGAAIPGINATVDCQLHAASRRCVRVDSINPFIPLFSNGTVALASMVGACCWVCALRIPTQSRPSA